MGEGVRWKVEGGRFSGGGHAASTTIPRRPSQSTIRNVQFVIAYSSSSSPFAPYPSTLAHLLARGFATYAGVGDAD